VGAQIISGKELAQEIRAELKKKVEELKRKGIQPGLVVILVGDDPASAVYVRNKEAACKELGIHSQVVRLGAETSQEELLGMIDQYNNDGAFHGILVQLPLPGHIDEAEVLRRIDPRKDVDGFHVMNAGSLFTGLPGLVACTPLGIMKLIEKTGVEIQGKNAVVIGRSNIVGKPVAILQTVDLPGVCSKADILVAAIGRPEFVTGDFIKPGAVVIDVGTSRVDGKLKGDVKFDEAVEKAGYITPVPGGVGPMTITMLMSNTVDAARMYG